MLRRCVSVSLAILVLAPAAWADGRRIELRRDVAAGGSLSIQLLSGSVHVMGWGKSAIEVTGTVGADVEDVTLEGSEHHLELEVELRDSRRLSDVDADLEIRVPADFEVEIESVGASTAVEGVTGTVRVESVHGTIDLAAGAKEVEAETVSGAIVVAGSSSMREAQISTVSGTIEFTGPLARDGEYSFESVSGSITLQLEGTLSASFDVSTFGGKIQSEFGPKPERESALLPGQTLSFTEGAGDAEVSIEAFSGTIRIGRR